MTHSGHDKISDHPTMDGEIAALAKTYLAEQCSHWPELVVPAMASDSEAESLAVAFAARIRTPDVGSILPPRSVQGCDRELAACYLRRVGASQLRDQLITVLRAAKVAGHFVPWEFVFADQSPAREAYDVMKQLMQMQGVPREPMLLYLPLAVVD